MTSFKSMAISRNSSPGGMRLIVHKNGSCEVRQGRKRKTRVCKSSMAPIYTYRSKDIENDLEKYFTKFSPNRHRK